MKIYFSGSIRSGRENVDLYFEIIHYLKRFGIVLTEHIGDKNITADGEGLRNKDIYERDMLWLEESDVFIAEVSKPSLGIGYEIRRAVELNKKILCLIKRDNEIRLSAMISGCPNITVKEYSTIEEAKVIIDEFLS